MLKKIGYGLAFQSRLLLFCIQVHMRMYTNSVLIQIFHYYYHYYLGSITMTAVVWVGPVKCWLPEKKKKSASFLLQQDLKLNTFINSTHSIVQLQERDVMGVSLGGIFFSGCMVFWVISRFLDLFLTDLDTDSFEKLRHF